MTGEPSPQTFMLPAPICTHSKRKLSFETRWLYSSNYWNAHECKIGIQSGPEKYPFPDDDRLSKVAAQINYFRCSDKCCFNCLSCTYVKQWLWQKHLLPAHHHLCCGAQLRCDQCSIAHALPHEGVVPVACLVRAPNNTWWIAPTQAPQLSIKHPKPTLSPTWSRVTFY